MESRRFDPYLAKLLRMGILIMLVTAMTAVIYGHAGGASRGLTMEGNYLTEYMKAAPHWPWLIVASFCHAIVLLLLALVILLTAPRSWFTAVGCLFLGATAMSNFFVAYSPVRAIAQPPPPPHRWWTPAWWFTSKAAQTPFEQGQAEAYADVHYRATRLSVVTAVAGIVLVALGALDSAETRRFGYGTLALAAIIGVLFFTGDQVVERRGLWQRLGFLGMYGWFWAMYLFGLRWNLIGVNTAR